MSAMILEVSGLSKRFGGTVAVADVTFQVPRGSIFGVIGPNGAGKTTLFNLLTGFIAPDSGSVKLEGTELMGHSPEAICKSGVCRTFQITRPFPNLTVLDNVIIAALARASTLAGHRDGGGIRRARRPLRPAPGVRPLAQCRAAKAAPSSPAHWRRGPSCCCSMR